MEPKIFYGIVSGEENLFVGIDSQSGGYPYRGSPLAGARTFSSKEDRDKFMESVRNSKYIMSYLESVRPIKITVQIEEETSQ